jgi:adenine phosphoribosyltransferase
LQTLDLRSFVRDVADFPKKGILFKDITPMLHNPEAFHYVIDLLATKLAEKKVNVIAGIESRGFIFSPTLAYKLGVSFVPVRKKGKLPWKTKEKGYALEYGEAILEMHEDAISKGQKVAIIDDLLATGGTAEAAGQLIKDLGGDVVLSAFVIELEFLEGRKKLTDHDVYSILKY